MISQNLFQPPAYAVTTTLIGSPAPYSMSSEIRAFYSMRALTTASEEMQLLGGGGGGGGDVEEVTVVAGHKEDQCLQGPVSVRNLFCVCVCVSACS